MSEMINQDLINACIDEINSWKQMPKESHISEPSYIDLEYQHILLLYTLKNIYDVGMDKSDLARQIIMELDYWTSATPYADQEDFNPQIAHELNRRTIAHTSFLNNRQGWNLLVKEILASEIPNDELRKICQWNDPNGSWMDTEAGMADHCGYVVSEIEMIGTIVQWAQEANT